MRIVASLLLLGTVSFGAETAAQETDTKVLQPVQTEAATVELGQRYTLQSAVLGETRELLVRVPAGYEAAGSDARYPVIFVLDGDSHFGHASLGANLLEENGHMPEAIIVALPNGQGTRGRDLSRAQENFRRFISEEVFAFVEANYRTNGHRTLFGHSLAGFFTLTMLAEHKDMFDNYIAASPVAQVRGGELIGKLEGLFASDAELAKSVYFTLGTEHPVVTDALNRMVAIFEASAPEKVNWRYDFEDAQVHMTTPFLTVYQGLSHVFKDYQAPRFDTLEAFEAAGGMPTLKAYFGARAEKYGVAAALPQPVLRGIAFLHTRAGKHNEALALFRENLEAHPESPRAHLSLGDGLDAAGQLEEAREAYKVAVRLATEQELGFLDFFQNRLARLEAKMAE